MERTGILLLSMNTHASTISSQLKIEHYNGSLKMKIIIMKRFTAWENVKLE